MLYIRTSFFIHLVIRVCIRSFYILVYQHSVHCSFATQMILRYTLKVCLQANRQTSKITTGPFEERTSSWPHLKIHRTSIYLTAGPSGNDVDFCRRILHATSNLVKTLRIDWMFFGRCFWILGESNAEKFKMIKFQDTFSMFNLMTWLAFDVSWNGK